MQRQKRGSGGKSPSLLHWHSNTTTQDSRRGVGRSASSISNMLCVTLLKGEFLKASYASSLSS